MPGLVPVADAIARIVAGVERLPAETVPIEKADGRVLAEPANAKRTQPPFDASAMDGYAVRAADVAAAGVRLNLIGESAAGRRYPDPISAGEAVRIFTGAPMPEGADGILIQENATREGEVVIANQPVLAGRHVRRAGYDFREGAPGLPAGAELGMRELALCAAMGYGHVSVVTRPRVAIIATGDELVAPGSLPGPDQIVASNSLALCAHVRACGGEAIDMGIIRDDEKAIRHALGKAIADRANVIITIGGASVGDHDLVRPAVIDAGFELDFWKIGMRPGKPLIYARGPAKDGAVRLLGLPGNPASSIVCSLVFLTPLLDALLGRPTQDHTEPAVLSADLFANDERQDYVRARITPQANGLPTVAPLPLQDSGMLSALTKANCLLIRAPFAPEAKIGEPCRVLRLP